MPVLNGSKTLTKVKTLFPQIKIIILSKYHDEELIKDLFNRGINGFISKSSSLDILITCLNRVAKYGIFKDNLPNLLATPTQKDGHYYKLIMTKRELQVMGRLYNHRSYKQIGEELYISEKTVENHTKNIFKKMCVKTRSEFCMEVAKTGLSFLLGFDTIQ